MTRERKPRLAAVVNPECVLLELEAGLRALESKLQTLPEETPDLVIETLTNQFVSLRLQIAKMPAQGIGGAAVKLRQLLAAITEIGADIGSTLADEPTVRTALEAAERLARDSGALIHDSAAKGGRLH